MKPSLRLSALAAAWVAGCGSSDPSRELTGVAQSPIEDGTSDSTHGFMVAVIQMMGPQAQYADVCSGTLLAPNLVATARHCVATLASPQIMCGTSTFGALVPEGDIYVFLGANISSNQQSISDYRTLAPGGILVPADAGQTDVCGNDIALLILDQNVVLGSNGGKTIDLGNYVVPAINPPMTDPSYSTTVTAIGYGIDTPTDDAGATAGVRRIKENIPLSCIPGDANARGLDCFKAPNASLYEQILTATEFLSGDASTCQGDSGSGAFDQAYFNKDEWVSFGVLSRGSVSPDGQTCVQPIYTRFDAWSDLLVAAAKQAQAMAQPSYPLPLWATGATLAASLQPASTSSTGAGAPPAACVGGGTATEGTPCACANDCASNECVSIDGTSYVCANPCSAGPCSTGFSCRGSGSNSYCFPATGATAGSSGSSGGCAAAPLDPAGAAQWRSSAPLAGLALAGLLRARRRRRGRPGPPPKT